MFRYEHPEHLWLLAAVPLLALLVAAYWFWRKNALARLGNVERVMTEFSGIKFWLKNALLAAGLALLAIAWANPQLGAKKQTVRQESSDVFVALDISQSMMCQDVAPSRLELAKAFTQKLVQTLEGERIGLIFFAGNAFLQMPLSTDYSFIIQSIRSAAPDLITEQGTAVPSAIELAQQSFGYEPGGGRAIILITDGEDHDEGAVERADQAFDEGIVIYAIGAGTPGGGPIPIDGLGATQYKRDDDGEIVRTHLNEHLLQKIALAGGGRAFNVSQGDAAVSAIRREVDNLQKRELEVRSFAEFESWYQWFLLPALLLLLLDVFISFRKRKGMALLFVLLSLAAVSAQSAHKSLRNGDEQYDLEHYKEAEQHYRNAADKKYGDPLAQYNLGNAFYQQGNWADAASRFEQAARSAPDETFKADALHNLGNAQLKQHKFKEAVEAYENSLRHRPGDAETKQNLQMAKKKLKEEEQRQQQEQQQQNQQQQDQQQQPNQYQQNQQDNQQQNQQQQNQPQQPNQGQQPQEQPPANNQKKLKKEEAQRLLETAIGPEDQKNARKYREKRQQPKPSGKEKDW